MPTPLTLILTALAVFRLTKLVVDDYLMIDVREWVIQRAYGHIGAQSRPWGELLPNDPHPPATAYLVTCPWCVSMWLAAPCVAALYLVPAVWLPVAVALAASAVTGIVSERL